MPKRTQQHPRKSTARAPRTINQYRAKSERFQDIWNRVTHVVSKMRSNDVSLRQASREFGLAPQTVIRLAGSALRKRASGHYAARAHDSLLRVLVIPTTDGLLEIALRDSRQASQLGEYWAAVQRYLETGDATALRKISRKTITDASGKRFRLIKDVGE